MFANLVGHLGVRSVWVLLAGSAATVGGLALVWIFMMMLMSFVGLIILMIRTPLPVRAKWSTQVVDPLIESDQEYCLLLRPFGYDGEIVLPVLPPIASEDLPWHRRPGAAQGLIQRTKPIEQIIAESVREACRVRTYSVVDQGIAFAPPGPTYLRARNDRWHLPVHRLIARAHTILVLLPPDVPIGRGLEWEMAQVAYLGLQSRVVFILPPPDNRSDQGCPPAHRLFHLMALLRHGATAAPADIRYQASEYREYALESPILAWLEDGIHVQTIGVDHGRRSGERRAKRRHFAVETYTSALVPQLREMSRERADLGFDARYEARHWPEPEPLNAANDIQTAGQCVICDKTTVPKKRRHRATVLALVVLPVFGCLFGIRWYWQDSTGSWPEVPPPSASPTINSCIVGTWRLTHPQSAHRAFLPPLSGSAATPSTAGFFTAPSPRFLPENRGIVFTFGADGAGSVSWNDARLESFPAAGSEYEVVAQGHELFRYTVGAGRLSYRSITTEGVISTQWSALAAVEPLRPVIPPEGYSCSHDDLILRGPSAVDHTVEWQVRLRRKAD
ncbi:hypothetical protein GCM10020358_55960 [Amorphoplanes nipponensis]|uniref:Uncharacterized protein n=1 Tax=Actinoplanes nipponensis TaxID=135950 RepID=A0A919JM90_9ACTN|nr:hypothetical protein [Actinoplanes nipponensis]GIE51910.1 hypothetical protein Ani05nite_54440 [Actinoplanes nipponensis]